MSKKGIETILNRNHFYWESTRRLELAIVLLILVFIGLCGFSYYLYRTAPPPKYFPTSADGVPIQPVPLNDPFHPTDYVINWAQNAILRIYSLDFVNFRLNLQESQIFFTTKGFLEFKHAYYISNNLLAVQRKKEVVSAAITGQAVVQSEGVSPETGIYRWNLNIPVTITYQNSANEVINQVGRILMWVQRASLLIHAEGLAIDSLILQAE